MKIWIKYLIAAILGVAFGLFVPIPGAVLDTFATVAVNILRVILVPLLLFSVPVAVHELHGERKLLRTILRCSLYSLIAIFLMTIIGATGAILFADSRIPLSNESGSLINLPSWHDLLVTGFPANLLAAFSGSEYLLPVLILGIVLGLAFSTDKNAVKPVLQLTDALSRLVWHINSFIVEIFPLPLIALSAARIATLRGTIDFSKFARLFQLLGIETGLIIVILLPLVLFLGGRRTPPLRVLYALIAPAIVAIFSANAYAPASVLSRHLKESLGVRRRVGSISLPLTMLLGRPGTALVAASSFIVILNSYSTLGLGPRAFFYLALFVPLSTLLVAAAPALGPAACIAFLSQHYGKGFESGYLLILPIALPLQALGVFLDSLIHGAIVYLTANAEHETTHKDTRHFI
ncbi:MAG: hypothetical protein A2087_04470 [Spirochaetes bacterium GWD1_61_31]|nr:MAG: hypothetical protein A2Y37_06355 [Spirochaetes bacterium GWB1_60_80]OHD33444.1 MAG: hypothetical protein A2004_06160 [Spirochaetes bacterium GWC1_61_12]OHD40574.1 MAG: hypothetical protein A2087_04470 [Spirochaetes bacterium GWD1_61_31]OHD59296.1 MAG: hypothetical protein A2Y32_09865 [Spirochaetes bacterium GWF1_60_12]HAP44591.1 hypothetical protein [Spirochaetaceae bacterium]